MIADRIKALRENHHLTQAELAEKLGITRSAVNAWEMGISVPSTPYIVRLAALFQVSTDYLLCVPKAAAIDISGLTEQDKMLVYTLVSCLREKNSLLQNEAGLDLFE